LGLKTKISDILEIEKCLHNFLDLLRGNSRLPLLTAGQTRPLFSFLFSWLQILKSLEPFWNQTRIITTENGVAES